MTLKLKHIITIITSLLFVACAMETKRAESAIEAKEDVIVTEEVEAMEVAADIDYEFSNVLVQQKLQDFFDLLALQNEHPDFNKEVAKQLKNFTKDSINNFKAEDFFIIKNIRQEGAVVMVNDSIQKIKLSYDKVANTAKQSDTIYAIITKKTIEVDDRTLVSNKIQFSKN